MIVSRRIRLCRTLAASIKTTKTINASTSSSVDLLDSFNRDIRAGGIVPVFKFAKIWKDKVAVQDVNGQYTYNNLFNAAGALSRKIEESLHGQTQKTIAYLCTGDASHIITQWAIWMSGNIAVPLCSSHPSAVLEYYLLDSGASLAIAQDDYAKNLPDKCEIIALPPNPQELLQDSLDSNELDANFFGSSDALILYTSGTTNKPKGVVYSYRQLAHQIASLHTAWSYKYNDVVLHALPLHHVHGQVNSVMATLCAGGTLRMLPKFEQLNVWTNLLGMDKKEPQKVSVFMGVPTMYVKLIDEYDRVLSKNARQKEYIRSYLSTKIRLMISGSAPLPTPIFESWKQISGHHLLERYGMTEVGMALSNPYEPMSERIPGYVGVTLPGVNAQIVSDDGNGPALTMQTPAPSLEINPENYDFQTNSDVKNLFVNTVEIKKNAKCRITFHDKKKQNKISGHLLISGSSVFKKYWNRPDQTKAEFTEDGWFKTGDTAMYEDGKIKILGRTSMDIIKSGGYKISALTIETALLAHPAIADIAILGMPDITWGEKVSAVVQLMPTSGPLSLTELQKWGSEYLPKYQLPTELIIMDVIPRNAMGKVNKKELKQMVISIAKKE